jgi:endonuclease III
MSVAEPLIVKLGKERFSAPLEDLAPEIKDLNAIIKEIDTVPHSFVLGCLMDRQIDAERAWKIPHAVFSAFKTNNIDDLAQIKLEEYTKLFERESLHRFNPTMADVFLQGVLRIKTKYNGIASQIWSNRPSGSLVVQRFYEFHGAGPKIASMAAILLVKFLRVPLSDYSAIDVAADVHVVRVMQRLGYVDKNVPDNQAREQAISKAKELNPAYPGIIDAPCWEIGRKWCHAQSPECSKCIVRKECAQVF